MKQAGQKSSKEGLPKQRKGPKRTEECRLNVPTHIWEQDAAGSNPVTRTTSPRTAYRSRRLFCKSHRSFILSRLLSKSNPLRWVSIWFSFLRASSPIITRGPNNDNPNCMIQVGNVFGFILLRIRCNNPCFVMSAMLYFDIGNRNYWLSRLKIV